MKEVEDSYYYILQQAALAGDTGDIEMHLSEAFELGRALVAQNVPLDEVLYIYHGALLRLSRSHPALPFAQVVDHLSLPLMETLMAYGLAFGEQTDRRCEDLVVSRLTKLRSQEMADTVAADILNNFNNLLGSIIGFAEMAGDELPVNSSARRNLKVMMGNLSSLLHAEQTMRDEIILSERRFRTLVENSPDIIVRHDQDGRCTFVNPAFSRETGISSAEMLGKSIDDGNVWLPAMVSEEYCGRLQDAMESGIPALILLEWQHPEGRRVSHEMYVVPEFGADGKASGTLTIGRNVTQRVEVERQLLHQSNYDVLTGLPNRRLLADRLSEEIAKAEHYGDPLALLVIDLDRFKQVNDTLGHVFGDQLLAEAAQRICRCVRESDTVARMSGDEFVVILPGVGDVDPLARIAQSIVTVMAESFHLDEQNVYVTGSIGIAVFPLDADNAEALIGCSDQAMYASKVGGRNSFAFFTPRMQEYTQQRLQLSGDLRKALEKGQLEVHYQPIIEVGSGRVCKAEALLRWLHPVLGFVPPDQFIPIAEETGLIQEIGAWVLQETMATIQRWNALGGCGQISVNMSPRQFVNGNSDQLVIACLQNYTIDSGQIAIEITEGLLLDDSPSVMEQVNRLRREGIQISLDDFGTGYSAMAYLKKFNIDYLKIDRSFVCDLETNSEGLAITEAIVMMAHRLGIKVIAEGVETPGQLALLAAVGCEYAQGYLYARPMPVETFLDFADAGAIANP